MKRKRSTLSGAARSTGQAEARHTEIFLSPTQFPPSVCQQKDLRCSTSSPVMTDDTLRTLRFHTFSVPKKPAPPLRPRCRPVFEQPFSCTLCGTTRTPLRRLGPTGRRTLCNACGLKWARQERLKREGASSSSPVASQISLRQQCSENVNVLAQQEQHQECEEELQPLQSKMAIAALLN